jgi:hypothetical protein
VNDQTIKADAGKPRLSLVPMRRILYDCAEVREYGNSVYGDPEGWRRVKIQRYIDALLRHTVAFAENPLSIDRDSGLPHYKHMACNMAFICDMMPEFMRRSDEGSLSDGV